MLRDYSLRGAITPTAAQVFSLLGYSHILIPRTQTSHHSIIGLPPHIVVIT